MPLEPGTTLGPYAVTAKIGEGGMGEVYRARATTLDRDVAIKVLPEAFASDAERLARFEREAKVLASLNHPNIGAIYGLETSGDTRALVVEGPTLADRIKQGAIPLDEALPIAKQIAEALEAAHEAGVIHRDLKPANIKVRDDGTVKVLDFGLAKTFQPDANDANMSQSPTISLTAAATQMGMVIGTAAYMAPEQAKGKVVDKRADVWAFGAVLFEMLTGQKPFVGDDVSDTLAAVLRADVDLGALPDDTPAMLRRVISACLQRDPKQRVHDVADVRLAMEGAFETVGAQSASMPTPTPQVWQRPGAVLTAVVTAVLVTGLAVWTLTSPAPPQTGLVSRFQIPLAADQTFGYAGLPMVDISPDGSQIVYTANDTLWLRPVDQLQAIQVPGTDAEVSGPFFSADGQSIGFWADGQLKKVAVSGGAPVTLADLPSYPYGASWGADNMILYGQAEGIMQVPGASGTPALLISVDEGETIFRPQMLPGGEWVLFTVLVAGKASWDEAQIVAQSVTTNERTVLIDGGQDGRYLPTGHLVYFLNTVLFAVPFDVGTRQVTGAAVPLVDGVRQVVGAGPRRGAAQFSVSTTGSLVYVPESTGGGDTHSLSWVDRDGDEEKISAPPDAYGHPRVSPDGTRVAVDITDGGNTDIWIWDLNSETPTQLTFDAANDDFPLWTLDSARVVFQSSRNGGGVFWKAADGTGRVDRLKEGAARPSAWTADGRLIFEQRVEDIGVLTLEGQRTVETLLDADEFSEYSPALSPDGRWLAYVSTETGTPLIYVRPFPNIDDDQRRVSPDFGVHPVWSPDGRELFYRGQTGAELMVARIELQPTFSARAPEPAFRVSGWAVGGGRQYDLAPNGDRFIFRQAEATGQTSDPETFNGLILVENWFEELTERVPID